MDFEKICERELGASGKAWAPVFNAFLDEVAKIVEEKCKSVTRAEIRGEQPRLYTRNECCEAWRISFPTFHAMTRRGEFEPVHIGGKTLVTEADFQRITNNRTRKPYGC